MRIPERDWKLLSRLKPLALDRLCRRILEEAQGLIAGAAEGEHHRVYLTLYRHIQKRDKMIADAFDDWRRSQAGIRLLYWRQYHLITDEEFAQFSPETQARVEFLLFGEG